MCGGMERATPRSPLPTPHLYLQSYLLMWYCQWDFFWQKVAGCKEKCACVHYHKCALPVVHNREFRGKNDFRVFRTSQAIHYLINPIYGHSLSIIFGKIFQRQSKKRPKSGVQSLNPNSYSFQCLLFPNLSVDIILGDFLKH